jgi:hypothetical protein
MRQSATKQIESHARMLLQVAEYLSRPQQFIAVAEARAAFRQTLERAHEASIVLTANGEPTVALVSFATLEAMRGALLHLLVGEMEASLGRVQAQVGSTPHAEPTSETELEVLVDDAIRRARHQPGLPAPHDP